MTNWPEYSDPQQEAITFSEWGQRLQAVLAGPDGEDKRRAIEGLSDLTRRLDGMWNDGGGAYAFAPQADLSIAIDECVID